MRTAFILSLQIFAISLTACDDRPRQWDAFVYPDLESSEDFERLAGFKSLENCRAAAMALIRHLPAPERAGFECGYMCAAKPEYGGTYQCEETRD